MKPSTRFSPFALLCLCLGLGQAQVHLSFTREVRDLSHALVGRDNNNPSLATWGSDYVFVVNATVGTPGQNVSLVISPSAADTWVPDATSSSCNYTEYSYYYDNQTRKYIYNNTYSSMCLWGSYDSAKSSTYQLANSKQREWDIYAPDSSYSSGTNFTDTLKVGSVAVDNLPMGLASTSDQWIGVLGLGANYSYYGGRYNNFPDRLLRAGQIATKAYSIWLDDEAGKSGSLLMGAIDKSRFDGALTRISAYSSTTAFYGSFGVEVTAFNGSSSGGTPSDVFTSNELPFDATFGPAEAFSNLPDTLAKKVWSMAGATFNYTLRLATIPCDAASKATNGGARFAIQLAGADGPVLDVRLADLILPQNVAVKFWPRTSSSSSSSTSYTSAGLPKAPPNTCFFAVQNGSTWSSYSYSTSSYAYYNLGSALLRRSYMVFDIANQEIALAPVKFGTPSAPQIVAFDRYGAPAPSATKYCGSSSSCYATSSSGASGGYAGGGSNSTLAGIPDPALVAGLSVAFGLVSLLALLGALVLWKRVCFGRRDKSAKEVGSDVEEGGDAHITPAPVMPGGRGPELGSLPTVKEEMREESRDGPPQLAPVPTGGPIQEGERGTDGALHQDLPHDSGARAQDTRIENAPPTGVSPAAVGDGKGKDVAAHEE